MRIFYIGELNFGGTCSDRLRVIQDLGVPCESFDVSPYQDRLPRLLRSVEARTNFGPGVVWLNRELLRRAEGISGITHVWVDKGKRLFPSTLERLRHKWGAKLIHYTPDPQFTYNQSFLFRRGVPLYDLMFTTKPYEMDLYRAAGARQVVLTYQAYERTRFRPMGPTEAYACDVGFVGHCEAHYAGRILAAAETARPAVTKVWGQRWPRYAATRRSMRALVQGDGVWGDEYPKALCSSKIALGLLSKLVPETTTTRTFEIPACGVFMLAERTAEHQSLFEEGTEAEFFGSDEELADKVRFYLANPEARQRVAAAGRERSVRSGYSNHDRLGEMLRQVREKT